MKHDWKAEKDEKNPGYVKWVCLKCGSEERGMRNLTDDGCKGEDK